MASDDFVKRVKDKLQKRLGALLVTSDVYAGVPADKTDRKETEINNASLAYIHNRGSPANNIPARPFMAPGIKEAEPKIIKFFGAAAKSAISGDQAGMVKNLNLAGLASQNAIKAKINEGVEPQLSESTLASRRRRGRTGTKPLVDTAQMRNSITYVLRRK